ncbi:hypothetical protein [Pseudonocardia sp. H11422]|uniref:hypothetical protein n=1 Tax=Pseudonocardia sp. H11422 TaxID=2835866 RepID=UPI002028D3A3|nr:hypothetical protein [Pseudonocardia sp. H11422]
MHDGLVRADQIVGIDAYPTPEIAGKPSRWLLDVSLAVPVGSGGPGGWEITSLHRTLAQTSVEPGGAPLVLAKLLAELDAAEAAGVLRAVTDRVATGVSGDVRFTFDPFDGGQQSGGD